MPACHAGGRGFESRPVRKKKSLKRGFFLFTVAMSEAYNFIAAWQLFPEKGTYDRGQRPKSGQYRIEALEARKVLRITQHWVTLEDQACESAFEVHADGESHDFDQHQLGDRVKAWVTGATHFTIEFFKEGQVQLRVTHEILPNGYLKVEQEGFELGQAVFANTEVYHKQLSVLPYAASVSGAVIKPTEEGMIRHKALTAMEEQTNMQLMQIRQQIELLALQAKEIHKRKELSMLVYGAKLNFSPVIGQTYHLYEAKDGSYLLSMVSPREWGSATGPYKSYVAAVQLLADHTWKEI
jgi:hypothetical protein